MGCRWRKPGENRAGSVREAGKEREGSGISAKRRGLGN